MEGIWIPKEVVDLKGIKWAEKVLLSRIIALDNEEGCWANNNHFAEVLDICPNRASKLINKLVKLKLISSDINQKQGNRRVLKYEGIVENVDRYSQEQQEGIVENNNRVLSEINRGYCQKEGEGIVENVTHIIEVNKDSNKELINNKEIDKEKEGEQEPVVLELFPTSSPKGKNEEKGKKKKVAGKKKKGKRVYTQEFEVFWGNAERYGDKGKTFDQWEMLTDAQKMKANEKMIEYREYVKANNTPPTYQKRAHNWLEGDCFESSYLIDEKNIKDVKDGSILSAYQARLRVS